MSAPIDMSKHFTTGQLLRFTAPSMAMMVFTSIYGIVDGFFISNFAGKTSFAAVNLIMPFIMILGSLGFMVGTGGSALVAHARGEGDNERANRWFSTIIWATFGAGIVLSLVGAVFMEEVSLLLGASEDMLADCVLYGRMSMISLCPFILQFAFQPLFSTAGKPNLGFWVTVLSGGANIVLDFVLVGLMGMEVVGAALATNVSEFVGGLIPLVYFLAPNKSALRLGKPAWDGKLLLRTCTNGSSEMMASVATSIVSILYNYQLMAYIGEDGVSAYGVIMYAGWIFGAILSGYGMGAAPLMSFQHGANNGREKRSLFRHGVAIMETGGLIMLVTALLATPVLSQIFVGYDEDLYNLTAHAFRIYSLCLLFTGFSMFGSSLFTALGNGIVSAVISFVRTLIFECGAVMLLPLLFGIEGIWYSVVVAEMASSILVIACLAKFGARYDLRPFLKERK